MHRRAGWGWGVGKSGTKSQNPQAFVLEEERAMEKGSHGAGEATEMLDTRKARPVKIERLLG